MSERISYIIIFAGFSCHVTFFPAPPSSNVLIFAIPSLTWVRTEALSIFIEGLDIYLKKELLPE